MNFVPDGVHRMFQLTQRGPREDMGQLSNVEYKDELSAYAIWPRGTRTRGTQVRGANLDRPEMVSLVPPPVRNGF